MDPAEQIRVLAGRYRLDSVIGRGGMGVVWRARDQMLNRDVAVKEIVWAMHLDEEEREDARRRAIVEARTAAQLSHPNVVRIYDILTENGRPWIVMEYLPYRSLRDIVREDGPLDPGAAAQIGLGVLAALGAAHAEGILHRDVKPANVLVGPHGRVVLTDFGIARAADSTASTASGAVVGSPPYIAPERARGGQAGVPGDMWGLGATLYTAVEGRPPFEADSALATLAAVVAEDPEPVPRAGPLWPVIEGLLRKDPDQRLDAAGAGRMLAGMADGGPASPALVASAPADGGGPASPALVAPEPADGGGPASPAPRTPEPADGDWPTSRAPVPPELPARSAGGGGRRRSWRAPAIAAAAALVVIGAASAAGALWTSGSPHHGTSAAGRHSPGHSHSPARSSPSRPASSPAGVRSPSPSAPATTAAGGYGALPAGFRRFTDSTGFSIGVPRDWRISHAGHYVYITDPSNAGIYLLIDQSDQPKPDPLADWEQQQASRAGGYPDYHLVRLESIHYPQAEKAADWEFTYTRNGEPTHVLNRNVLANPRHAYALYWTTPDSDWSSYYRFFRAFAGTFRPAP